MTMNRPERPIYLDNQATTPTDPRVVEAMTPYFTEKFGNPHSTSHFYGWEAEEAVERARAQLAALIGADVKEIVFTSGATEANNLAIKGAARFYRDHRDHIVTCATEHKCVLESVKAMAEEGFSVTWLPVGADGLVDLGALEAAITERTLMVSIMAAHNEIGVLQPIEEIGALTRERKVFFHTDAAQALGKIPLDVEDMNIDLMSLSGHKVYGPMGIGALYIRRRPRVRLTPLFSGGGQERGLRSGTLPAPLAVGFGTACKIAADEMGAEAERLRMLRDRFHAALRADVPDLVLNGHAEKRLPGNLNFSFPGVDADSVMAGLRDLAVSSGSACTSAEVEPSYTLRALGLDDDLARASVRIGIGRFNTEREIDYAAKRVAEEIHRLRDEPDAAHGRSGAAAMELTAEKA
jgi:cysteine desulfurase